MPFTDTITIANNGAGTAGSAVPSTAPALPTIVSNGHLTLHNGSGTNAVGANDKILLGTKFIFDPIYGNRNMFCFPSKQTNPILVEYASISTAAASELYTDIVNYSSSSLNLTASEKLFDMVIVPQRKPLKIVVS